jgi:hypothetical protein
LANKTFATPPNHISVVFFCQPKAGYYEFTNLTNIRVAQIRIFKEQSGRPYYLLLVTYYHQPRSLGSSLSLLARDKLLAIYTNPAHHQTSLFPRPQIF